MKKDDNDWNIDPRCEDEAHGTVEINGETYYAIDDKTAAICHCLLLLVDAVNDKSVKN